MDDEKTISAAMLKACEEARRWIGATSPNPPVGAAGLASGGGIIATAAHRRAGEAHAERALIEKCRASGQLGILHTLCVTLSPCNHHGLTPPCCDIIIESGIQRVVIGTMDPNPKAAAGAIERLRGAGIEVITGVEEEKCRQLIYAFAYSIETGRPWITVKRAFDENGSMIPPPGAKTFTSDSSLLLAHRLRKRADAILTGSGTILADNPDFTVRLVPDYPGKKRFLAVLDRRRRVPAAWLEAAHARGLEPAIYDSPQEAIGALAALGTREILVEAGPLVSGAMLKQNLWNLSVTIRKGEQDSVETAFNPRAGIPFDTRGWKLENSLPA